MLLLGLLVFGLFVGWLANFIVGGRGQVDWVQCLVAGVVGSFVGGLLISLIAGDGLSFRASGVIGSIVGAVIVLLIWNAIRRRGAPKGKPTSKGRRR